MNQQTDKSNLNPATVWAEIMVDELVRGGLTAVCVAPGSRSTALALAFAAHAGVSVYRHLDERSAAYFALGMALFGDKPVALLCTSGTAAANFFPAIVEARMSQVPLLVLTADRPPELRHSGANQTIDQVKLYGDQVLWSVDVGLPEQDAPPAALRNLRTLAARALAVSDGVVKGPVHLNLPFRKPFEPKTVSARAVEGERSGLPATQFERGLMVASARQVAALAELIEDHPRGLIVCGPRCPGGDFAQAVAALSQQAGYPIMADPLSGVRFGPWVDNTLVCGGYETYLRDPGPGWQPLQLVIRFGAVPTSKWLNAYLEREAPVRRIHVRSNGLWADDSHLTHLLLQADEARLCRDVAARLPQRERSSWQAQVRRTEEGIWRALPAALEGPFYDGTAVADLLHLLPAGTLLFAGNSLPIRHVDQLGRPASKRLGVFANRGASGIDGNTSTALGIAAAAEEPVVLLVGDVTFYHDMNGLLAVREQDLQVTVVLLNNGGGGIFHRLPVAAFDPPFTELFLTPHELDFSAASGMYGLQHVRVTTRSAFVAAFKAAMAEPGRRVIEVCTESAADYVRHREVIEKISGHR